jgi:hypothetical protein
MQKRLRVAEGRYNDARREHDEAVRLAKLNTAQRVSAPAAAIKPTAAPPEPHGIGWAYCTLVTRVFGVKAAEAAEPRTSVLHRATLAQDTVPKKVAQDTTKKPVQDTTRKAATVAPATQAPPSSTGAPRVLINGVLVDPSTGLPVPPAPAPATTPGAAPQQGVVLGTSTPPAPGTPGAMPAPTVDSMRFKMQAAAEAAVSGGAPSTTATFIAQTADARVHVDMARRTMNGFEIEIHKKFSLAAACLIFVILGAPIALRFPRGGVGLVIGVSLVVFALYYVGLIGGEALARKGFMPPFWAMWGTNVILTIVGIVLLFRMGHEQNSGRGGDWGDRIDRLRDTLRARRRVTLSKEAA